MRVNSRRTKVSGRIDGNWWNFDDSSTTDDLCDWCGTYVGRRIGSGKFVETSIRMHGMKESGRLCSEDCKESWERHHIKRIERFNNMFPPTRNEL